MSNIYSYDPLNRLNNSNFGYFYGSWCTTDAFDASYTYDKDGNIVTNTWNDNTGANAGNLTYHYPAQNNRLTSTSGLGGSAYTYDENGNVCKDPSRNVSLIINDMNNLPVTIYTTTGQEIRYFYDATGNRIRKQILNTTTGNVTSDIYYVNGKDGKTAAVDWSYSGTNYTFNLWGNDMIGQIRINGTALNRFYYLKDHLGTVRMTVDASANVVSYDDYYPYGMVMPTRSLESASEDARYKFTSKERDSETKYDYFDARYYDGRIGRWLSIDPRADKYPDAYNYCFGNPLKHIDPDGQSGWDIVLGVFSAIAHNVNPSYKDTPVESHQGNQRDYAAGRIVGDVVTAMAGGVAVVGGSIAAGGGAVVSGSGVGAIAGVPVAAGGGVVAGAGAAVTASSICHLGDDVKSLQSNSNKQNGGGNKSGETKKATDSRTAQEIISQEKKGTINKEFPGQWLDKTVKEINAAEKTGDASARKAHKLLTDKTYRKATK